MAEIKSIMISVIILCLCINCVKLDGICLVCSSNDKPDCAMAPENVDFKLPSTDKFCSTYIDEKGATIRALSKKECTDNSCVNCDATSEPCNTKIFPENRLKCYQCTNCATLDEKAQPKPCLEYSADSKCFIDTKNSIRGCTNSDEFKTSCTGDNKCEECKDDGCNKDAEKKSCFVCDSNVDTDCSSPDKLPKFAKPCDSDCYHCQEKDGKRTVRVCGEPKDDKLRCNKCNTSNCNNGERIASCYVCNSKDSPNCKESPDKTEVCSVDNDKCFVQMDKDGNIVRGCKSSLEKDCTAGDETCKICDDNDCNDQKIKDEQLECYQCNDKEDCIKKQESEKNSAPCKNAATQCYMYSKDNESIQRGCMSDTDVPSECSNTNAKCSKCTGKNCNSEALKIPSPLKCIVCKEDEISCQFTSDSSKAVACSGTIFFWDKDACYTRTNNGKISRGCKSDLKEECKDCKECSTNGCNNQSDNKFTCYRCSSNDDTTESCAIKADKIKPTTCRKEPSGDDIGCYTYNLSERILRGCISDLSNIEQANCMNDNFKSCEFCLAANCNNLEPPNSSWSVKAGSLTIIAFIFILVVDII